MYLGNEEKKKIEEYLASKGMKNFKWYTLVNNWGVTYDDGAKQFDSRFLENLYGARPMVFKTTYSMKEEFSFVTIGGRMREKTDKLVEEIDLYLNKVVSKKGVK